MKRMFWVLAALLLTATPCYADSLSISPWTTGDALNATNLNSRHTTIQNWSTTIANDNIKAAAGVVGSKLDLTSGTGRIANSATLTSDQRILESSPTWNGATVTFEAWLLNVTDSASASESRLLDLQVDSVSKFYVGKGTATRISTFGEVPFIVASGPTLTFTGNTSIQRQRFVQFDAPIITNTTAMTVTDAATVYIASGPRCQGNVTCTNGYAFWVDNGTTRLDGAVEASSSVTVTGVTYLNNVVYVNDVSNAKVTTGLSINQGGADDEIFALKSSDVTHGMTTLTEADTFFAIKKVSAANGWAHLIGYSAAGGGITVEGRGTTDDTNKTTAGGGYVKIDAKKASAGSASSLGADANILIVTANDTTRFIFDNEGSAHADVEWTTYDTHDDLTLLASLERELTPVESLYRSNVESDLGGSLGYSREELQRAKIVNFYDDGPRAMVNFTRLSMLQSGAIRQVHRIVKDQDTKLGWAMSRIAHLERLLGQRPVTELATKGSR